MPKKKARRPSRNSAQHKQTRKRDELAEKRAHRERRLLLEQFVSWRIASVPRGAAENEATHVETLLNLKADQLGVVDPTWWSLDLIELLLLEVVPRKVIQPRELAMEQGPALQQFFDFLAAQGLWHERSDPVQQARRLVEGLEFEALEALDDPTRRSLSGNLLAYAATLGVTPQEPQALEDFFDWYNTALTIDERRAISDTGRLDEPSTPFEPGMSGSGRPAARGSAFFPPSQEESAFWPDDDVIGGKLDDELEDAEFDHAPLSWPWFLPEGIDYPVSDEEWEALRDDPAAFAALFDEVPMVQRAAQLLAFIGESRQVTSTGALRRADVDTLIEQWGLDPGPRKVTSMWDVPEIVGPWTALVAGEWLDMGRTKVYREPGGDPVPDREDSQAYTEFGKVIITTLLMTMVFDEVDGLQGGPDTFTALMLSAAPGGVEILQDVPPGLLSGDDDIDGDVERISRLWRTLSDLEQLSDFGLLRREDVADGASTRYIGNTAVLLMVNAVLAMLAEGAEGM
ncbi:hypothetical protein IOE58_06615 [Brachybacterium sp. Marseille-Q2903]|uniref:Uncharacterized protein n=1 Tax=Brachybacterium epidermidis TaxID=2781983 RepID=A0ABR9W0C2_9MICO|nr:hypothetical protein [Brachybacterium epidermidis]MBE9403872.1 hypothetical protein [Brachybacterium epidermidis]